MKKLLLFLILIILLLLSGIWMQSNKEESDSSLHNNNRYFKYGNVFSQLSLTPISEPILFTLNQPSAYPGDCLGIYISNAKRLEEFTVTVPFYDKPLTFFPYETGYVGLIPLYAWLTPGSYEITVEDKTDSSENILNIEVLPKNFDVQYLKISGSASTLNTDDNAAKDQVYFDAARAEPISEKLWEGPFIQPVQGEITTDYNSMRYTNDNPNPSRHLAIDIANVEGTNILAANNGKVVLAKKLIVTGNTVVIDHGMGIFSSSFHMSEINVTEGTYVSKGDVIGKMGSTGYSTGPHLHFAIWKEGTFLNPWFFIENDPISF